MEEGNVSTVKEPDVSPQVVHPGEGLGTGGTLIRVLTRMEAHVTN